jgi:hypothetical protein
MPSSHDPREAAAAFTVAVRKVSVPALLPRREYAFTKREIASLTGDMRVIERRARENRKRLEALLNGSARTCPQCGAPVTGRSDAVYCRSSCRIRAHRARRATDRAVAAGIR